MRHMILASVLFAGLVVPAHGLADTRYSGHIVAIGPGRHAITLTELERWNDGREDTRTLSIRLTPETVITTVTRTTPTASGWPGGFTERSGSAADLRQGEYVTVTAKGNPGHGLVAESIEIARPEGEAPTVW